MECIYLKDLKENSLEIEIKDPDIIAHIKALRLSNFENVFVSNGMGISAIGNFIFHNKNYIFKVSKFNQLSLNENNFNLSVLISALDSRERMEFAIEKAVELGIKNIFICSTQHSGRKTVKKERVELKVIAAFQQSMRTILPNIIFLDDLFDIFTEKYYFSEVFIADISGSSLVDLEINNNSLIIIGPEGGFSNYELKRFMDEYSTKFFKLGNLRLRSETAIISAITVFNYKLNK